MLAAVAGEYGLLRSRSLISGATVTYTAPAGTRAILVEWAGFGCGGLIVVWEFA